MSAATVVGATIGAFLRQAERGFGGDVVKAAAGAARVGYRRLGGVTEHGWRFNKGAEALMLGAAPIAAFMGGVYSARAKMSQGTYMQYGSSGIPEIRRPGDMGATGSLPLSLYKRKGRYL